MNNQKTMTEIKNMNGQKMTIEIKNMNNLMVIKIKKKKNNINSQKMMIDDDEKEKEKENPPKQLKHNYKKQFETSSNLTVNDFLGLSHTNFFILSSRSTSA